MVLQSDPEFGVCGGGEQARYRLGCTRRPGPADQGFHPGGCGSPGVAVVAARPSLAGRCGLVMLPGLGSRLVAPKSAPSVPACVLADLGDLRRVGLQARDLQGHVGARDRGAVPAVRAPRLPRAVLPDVAVVRVPVPRLEVQPGRREEGGPRAARSRPLLRDAGGRHSIIVDTGNIFLGPPIGTNTTGQNAEGPLCV